MEVLKQLVPLLLTISLAGLVLTVGMNSDRDDFIYVLRRPLLLAKSVLVVMIIPPIAAAIIVYLLPIAPVVQAGIILMAAAPVPPLVPGGEVAIGARRSFAYGLYVSMVLLSVVSVPIVFDLAAYMYNRSDTVPPAVIAVMVAKGVLAPMAVGFVIHRFAPNFAARAAPIIYKLSMVLVAVAFAPILFMGAGAMWSLIGNGTLLAMAVLVLICLGAGHFLGGPEWVDRGSLAIASSVRHPGIALGLASTYFADKHVQSAVLLFMLVGLVIGTIYKIWFKRVTAAGRAAGVPSPPVLPR